MIRSERRTMYNLEHTEDTIMEAYMYWRTIFRAAWGSSMAVILLGISGGRFALGHLPGDLVIRYGAEPLPLPLISTFLISFAMAGAFLLLSNLFSRR